MNWGTGITALLAGLGITLVVLGLLDQSSGDRDFPVVALGVLSLIAAGVLQIWSQRRP